MASDLQHKASTPLASWFRSPLTLFITHYPLLLCLQDARLYEDAAYAPPAVTRLLIATRTVRQYGARHVPTSFASCHCRAHASGPVGPTAGRIFRCATRAFSRFFSCWAIFLISSTSASICAQGSDLRFCKNSLALDSPGVYTPNHLRPRPRPFFLWPLGPPLLWEYM